MKNSQGTNLLIIHPLRHAATTGHSATQLLELWQQGVVSQGRDGSSRMEMMLDFRRAFAWSLAEVAILGAWQPFGDSAWTDEMINNRMAPLLEEWRTSPRPARDLGSE